MHHAAVAAHHSRCEICDEVGTMSLKSISRSIADNVRAIRLSIDDAARAGGREPGSVRLVAVSKTRPAALVREAAAAGCTDFGESYLQEALPKIDALADLGVTWHFIGAIQSNKTRAVAEHFHWVHTVSREKVARRLSGHCPAGKVLNITLQVNVDRDPGKAGVDPDDVLALLHQVTELDNLRVRGLMTILQRESSPAAGYRRLAELFDALRPHACASWDTLSMGMSGDFESAVAAGATHVRVGTAIFGERD
jgi:PLP dependent protein